MLPLLGLAPLAMLQLTAAASQDTPPDILVTAQRREEDPQDVPIALTPIGGDELDQTGARNLDRIGTSVPNLYLARNFGTTSGALVFLRGVGEGDSIFTNDPPVGIYVDDVLFPRSTGSMFDLLDVERIEVLRGPQGTLYGRNTSGGAIRLVTRRPVFTQVEGVVDATLGSYRRLDVRGSVNLPIADDIAVRLSGLSRTQAGWGRNLTDGTRVNGQDVQGGRASLLWEPTDTLSLFATADYTLEDSTPRFPQAFLPDPSAPGRFLNEFATPADDIDHFRSADTMPLNRTETGGGSLRIDYRTGAATLSSITGYRFLTSRIGFDQTANPPGTGANIILLQDQSQHSFSQELQLTGTAFDARLTMLAGLYYFNEHNDQLTAISAATPAGTPEARFRNGDFFNAPSRAASGSGNWSPYLPQLDTDSYSAFGSLTFAATPRLNLTAGLRYTHERKRYAVRFLSAPGVTYVLPNGTIAARRIADAWNDLSPRLALDYAIERPSWNALLFTSISKGFRSGSFDGRARNIDFVLNRQRSIAPETLWSYEAGVKSEWLNRKLRLNASYFVNDYTNIAFSAARANLSPPEIFRQNVGDARIQGVEAEVTAFPLPNLELTGVVGTLNDRLTRLASSPGCTAFVPNERDLDLRFTPDIRYTLRGSFVQNIPSGRLRLGAEFSGSSDYFIALCNEPQHLVDNVEAVNAHIGYETADGRWSLLLSGTNLTDRRYNSGSVGSIGYPVAPRQIDLTIRHSF